MPRAKSVRRLSVATAVCMLPFLVGCPQVDTETVTDEDGPNGPRAVSGACCISDDICEELTLDFCVTTAGGVFQGAGTECDDIICKGVVATGACCISDELCEELSQESCAATPGGLFQGVGTECDGTVCTGGDVTGACCLEGGTCLVLSTSACALGGGLYQGDDVSCDAVDCAVESPVGACCLPEGCIDGQTEVECDGLNGAYQDDGTACSDSDIACGPDAGTVPSNDLAESNPNVAFDALRSGTAVALTAPEFATLTRINEGCSCAWSTDGDGTFAPQSGEAACATSYTPGADDSSITVTVTCLGESRTAKQTVQVELFVAQLPPANPGNGGGGGTTDPCAGLTCNDNEACTTDICVNGTCVFAPVNDGTVCSDGNECTENTCVAGTCTPFPLLDGAECSQDGVFCNGREVCTAGACESSGPPCGSLDCNDTLDRCEGCTVAGNCPDDGNNCTDTPTCDTSGATNFCDYPASDNTTPCEDGKRCTDNDLCDGAGSCVSGGAVDCSGQDDACNIGVCNLADGTCVTQATNEGLACNDGNACTEGTSCTAGNCGGGTAVVCDDADTCTVDSCDPAAGCQFTGGCDPSSATPLCDQNNGVCVECLINSDCAATLFCNADNSCQPGTPVSGKIYRGDHNPPTIGTLASGRPITLEVRDQSGNPLNPAVQGTTVNGTYDLVIPATEFVGGNFTGTIQLSANDTALQPPAINISVAEGVNLNADDVVAFYNIYVALTGDDASDGTFADEYGTVQAATNDAQPGDTIFIRGGLYDLEADPGYDNDVIHFVNSGTPGRPITVEGYQDELVQFTSSGSRAIFDFSETWGHNTLGFGHYVFRKLTVVGGRYGWMFRPPLREEWDPLTDPVEDLWTEQYHDFVLEDIEVDGSAFVVGQAGIDAAIYCRNAGVRDLTARRCNFHHTIGTEGTADFGEWRDPNPNWLAPRSASHNLLFEDCDFHHAQHQQSNGIIFQPCVFGVTLRRCRAYNNGKYGFGCKGSGNFRLDRCAAWGNDSTQMYCRGFDDEDPGDSDRTPQISDILLTNCIFIAPADQRGGSALNWRQNASITAYNCTFVGLHGNVHGSSGGQPFTMGSQQVIPATTILRNCVVAGFTDAAAAFFSVSPSGTSTGDFITYIRYEASTNLFFSTAVTKFKYQGNNWATLDSWQAYWAVGGDGVTEGDGELSGPEATNADFNSLFGDPQFANLDPLGVPLATMWSDDFNDDVDLRVSVSSPATNLGENLSGLAIPELDVDFNGDPRPAAGEGAWTVGALQTPVP